MHPHRVSLVLVLAVACATASASNLELTVLDPAGAAVSGARVAVYRAADNRALAVQTTGARGDTRFVGLAEGAYRLEVLAPGFAARHTEVELPRDAALTVRLALGSHAETVVVTAARTPLATAQSGAPASLLDRETLETMRPTSTADALRFLPGAVVATNGRRGGLASLFVRGGESRYNKVLVDGVVINDPGGTFDFGVVPVQQVERLEFVRGAHSALFGSDAMTSVLQVFSATGHTRTPELRFGADGGLFATANGYASLAGARGRFDFNLFADQFHTTGQGVNDDYSNSSQGGNIGLELSRRAALRFRVRHSNSRTGVQSFWNFNGQPLIPPDTDQRARQNNFLASAELFLVAPARWQHRLSGFEYNHQRTVVDDFMDPGRDSPFFGNFDFPFSDFASINRAGFEYQGEYASRSWARTTFGYRFEVENGFVGDHVFAAVGHGLRRNHELYAQQVLQNSRLYAVAGLRFVHNESFGSTAVPRLAAGVFVARGGDFFSGTRLRFAYGRGIKEPRLEESFGIGGFGIIPNPALRAEESRSLEAGFEQQFASGKYFVAATYFHNLFRNQIAFSFDPLTFTSQYVNLNRALAHGAEVELHGRLRPDLTLDGAYIYTSTQILDAPLAFDPLLAAGAPLLRRPRHSGTLRLTHLRPRWGGHLGGSFVGRRTDSDFLGLGVTHAAGYARVDVGVWYALNRRVTAYANVENLLDRNYEESAGYPALGANFRAGLRFRLGGE